MQLKTSTIWLAGILCFFAQVSNILARDNHCSIDNLELKTQPHSYYVGLQKFVNHGHQPWRLDSQAVAARELISNLHLDSKANPYDLPLKNVEESETLAAYTYEKNGKEFLITLERPQWLLDQARKPAWEIWIPVSIEKKRCR